MAKEYAKAFYDSKQWRHCRKSFIAYRIAVDGGLCELCHDRLGYIVHHKRMLTPDNINDPNTTLSFRNLQYVCKECHDNIEGHGINNKGGERIEFDCNGDPIPPHKKCDI